MLVDYKWMSGALLRGPGIFYKKNFATESRYYYTFTGETDNGDFLGKVYVNSNWPDGAAGEPSNGGLPDIEYAKPFSAIAKNSINISSPAYSDQYILIDNEK